MATAKKVLDIAANEIGYYAPNDPEPGSKYGRWMAKLLGESWLAGPSWTVWWCCIFVSWVLHRAGQKCLGFPSYNTDVSWSKAKSLGVDKYSCKPGDIVIFDWNMGTAATDHIGFVEKNLGNGTIQTIEGNTSGTDWGSQYAGNGVHRRVRSLSLVRYCIRPPYDGSDSSDSGSSSGSSNTHGSSSSGVKVQGIGGKYVITSDSLNIREYPNLDADIVGVYKKGESVILDDKAYVSDGIVWGSYIGASSGKKRYIALGTHELVKRA